MRLLFITLLIWGHVAYAHNHDNLTLRYRKAAKVWEETLPLGNGRLGMMPDGQVKNEKIILNDISMWSGSKDEAINQEAVKYLPEIRKLLLKGDNAKAQKLVYEHFQCAGEGSAFGKGKNAPFGCFQMLGELHIEYKYPSQDSVKNYEFGLKLSDAIAYTTFDKGNIHYKREYFVSHANDVMIVRLSSDSKNAINLSLKLNREEKAQFFTKNKDLHMYGQLSDGKEGKNGVKYHTQLRVKNKDGYVTAEDNRLTIRNATEVTIFISSATNLSTPKYEKHTTKLLASSSSLPFSLLKDLHTSSYQKKFNRVSFNLASKNVAKYIPERLQDFQKDKDSSLAALYFNYGRYLMLSGTRENSMPMNLQGLWANTLQTPWNGDYHLNINLQMNYWPTEVCNLAELHKPLIQFTQSLVPSGRKTAKGFYNAKGWTAHVISNPWKFTAPGEHASWGATHTGGAWLCAHLWQHYLFSMDKDYLSSIYPTLREAAQFFLSTMIVEPKNKWLVTAPSSSPENGFYLQNAKEATYVCMGPTMDSQIVRELFNNVITAAHILKKEDSTILEIKNKLKQLAPTQISPKGYIQEWLEDYKEVDIHHRHVSHLYGLFPSNQISPSATPKLAEAAIKTLNRRGDGGTGWSRAWKINFWARLQDGNRAYSLLKGLLSPVVFGKGLQTQRNGGTYPNLFCAHPPFQIDGNFGGTSGIAEMLVQSHEDYILLLPAIPNLWESGSFKGLRVRGGATIDANWTKGKLREVTLYATTSNTFTLKVPNYVSSFSYNNKQKTPKNDFLKLKMKKGERITLKFETTPLSQK